MGPGKACRKRAERGSELVDLYPFTKRTYTVQIGSVSLRSRKPFQASAPVPWGSKEAMETRAPDHELEDWELPDGSPGRPRLGVLSEDAAAPVDREQTVHFAEGHEGFGRPIGTVD